MGNKTFVHKWLIFYLYYTYIIFNLASKHDLFNSSTCCWTLIFQFTADDTGAHSRRTATALSLSVLTAHLPLSFLSPLLVAVVVCSALGRLQRGALWRGAAAEIWLDPAKERREQVGQQRHPAVPRISGCRAVPPFATQTHTHIHHTRTHNLQVQVFQPVYTQTFAPCQKYKRG